MQTCLNPCSNGMKIECVCMLVTAKIACLNPCSNGMKIELTSGATATEWTWCLNPCSNGMKIECCARRNV